MTKYTQYEKNNTQIAIPQFTQRVDDNILVNTLSPIFTDIKDVRAILDASWQIIKNLENSLDVVLNNSFIQTCDLETLAKFEKLCNIIPNDNLDVDFRRAQVLQIFSAVLPYTEVKLKELLNTVCGEGNWELVTNINEYKLTIYVFESFTDMIETLQMTLITYIPAHIEWLVVKNILVDLKGEEYYGGWIVEDVSINLSDDLPDDYWNNFEYTATDEIHLNNFDLQI